MDEVCRAMKGDRRQLVGRAGCESGEYSVQCVLRFLLHVPPWLEPHGAEIQIECSQPRVEAERVEDRCSVSKTLCGEMQMESANVAERSERGGNDMNGMRDAEGC